MPDRHRTRAQERADDIDVSPSALVAQIETLTRERDAALGTAEEYLAALQRERAEFQNFKRRTTEERMRDLGLAGEDLIRKVLGLADDFDRAIEARPAPRVLQDRSAPWDRQARRGQQAVPALRARRERRACPVPA